MNIIKAALSLIYYRKRFPQSVIHAGAKLDKRSSLDYCSVLFANAAMVNSSLGAYSYVQNSSVIYNAEIGPFCSIAGNVTIGLAAHPTHMVSTSPVFYDNEQPLPRLFSKNKVFSNNLPRTKIGADVWVGQGAMIKAGLEIGVGAVIGAGSIVTKDVAPYTIVAGCPSTKIRMRFSDILCEKLLATAWWNLSNAELEQLAPFFADPDIFLDRLGTIHD